MPKAILELDMPESCEDCNLCINAVYTDYWYCAGITGAPAILCKCPFEGRRSDCPLRLVDAKEQGSKHGCELCNANDIQIDVHTKKPRNAFFFSSDSSVGLLYCPMCGRRLEVKP